MSEKKNKIGNKIGVWFAKAKNGTLLTFVSEPKRERDGWSGNYYVNSLIYENLKSMLNGSPYSWKDDPQYIEFTMTVQP